MNKIVLAAVATLALSGAAFAETAAVAAPEFAAVDTDANGTVSLVEAQVVYPALTAEEFAKVDADANGELTAEEFAALVAAEAAK